jgi:hypothetical protein
MRKRPAKDWRDRVPAAVLPGQLDIVTELEKLKESDESDANQSREQLQQRNDDEQEADHST